MKLVKSVINYLKANHLHLVTAESCTAGQIAAILGKIEGCGECLEAGFVVYSAAAKKRILGVTQEAIDKYTLTSEEIARQMVIGAFERSNATIGIATTGITGDKPMDGIPPGTICFAWGAINNKKIRLETETVLLKGSRQELQLTAAKYALEGLMVFYEKIKREEHFPPNWNK